ncbi:DUF4268 domain-containing protein [Candidatus Poribacteria bacterium]|nr:DUF4268 domain-containing protein [Candidatus Poribacteria bacterium]MYC39943.1 DUF4268 domain-containing protein [Candidatus Dadabacteria bacterium]
MTKQEKYPVYFQSLIDELREQHNFTNARRPGQGKPYYAFASGTTGIKYVAGFDSKGGQVYTALGIYSKDHEKNKAIFDALEERKSEIEGRFGMQLEWYRRDDIVRSSLGLWREGDIDSDEHALATIKAWHIENLLKFKAVFTSEIQRARETLQSF